MDSEVTQRLEVSPLGSDILTVKPVGEYRCLCVKVHRPTPTELHAHHIWPRGEGGPDVRENLVYLCPTSHASLHKYWRLLAKNNGIVPSGQRLPFTRYVRELAERGWKEMTDAQGDVSPQA